jgi:hypothetical protein
MKLFSFAFALALTIFSTEASAKIDPAVLVDTKEMIIFAKVDPKLFTGESIPFVQSAIAVTKKYLDSKHVKNVSSAVTYGANSKTYAGFLIGAPMAEVPGYQIVKIPASKALKVVVRGPFTEVPKGYATAAQKFRSMKNLKDLNQVLEVYVSPAGTPPEKLVTEIYLFMQVVK